MITRLALLVAVLLSVAASPEEVSLRERLGAERVGEVAVDAEPLSVLIESWRKDFELNIYVNAKAIEAAGFDLDAPVTLDLRDVQLGVLIEYALTDAAGGQGRLGLVVDNNILHVSTAEEVALLRTRRYLPINKFTLLDNRQLRALDQTMDLPAFDQVPLDEMVEWMNENTPLTLVLNAEALELMGVSPLQEVTVPAMQATPADALAVALKDAGGGFIELGIDVFEGVVHVSTVEDLQTFEQNAVFDIGDLLPEDLARRTEVTENIIELIAESIEPHLWKANGGTVGSIHAVGDKLHVTAPPAIIRETASLLDRLRGTRW